MANKTLFSSTNRLNPRANSFNAAGGLAYRYEPKHQLAQIAATGCFNNTFYASGADQLRDVLALVDKVDDNEFLAKLCVYSRQNAFMKDMPAALLIVLSRRDTKRMHRVFDRVVNNGRMLRTVFQMIRSGQFGSTGLSSSMQRAFQRWLNQASVGQLLSASIGNDPSLRDVLRMARPKPINNQRRALFGWLTGKEVAKWAPASEQDLPEQVQALDAFRNSETAETQALIAGDLNVRWDLLADRAKNSLVWTAIARKMGTQALRMNLNTLMRHGIFENAMTVDCVANRLADKEEVIRSRQFPYQFLAAYMNANDDVPAKIRTALNTAAEIACGNIPKLSAPIAIGLDVSGSMNSAATGYRKGSTSCIRCIDVAALFAAAVLRRNPDSVVIPFDTSAYHAKVDSADTILSLSKQLSEYGGGGTDCSLPFVHANNKLRNRKFGGFVLVSDNQSWIGTGMHGSTGVMTEWNQFVANQKRLAGDEANPKLVCIDIQPYGSTQAAERDDILNIGGFSDAVFNTVSSFLNSNENRFVQDVESIQL